MRVGYALAVPGGWVTVYVGTTDDHDFDVSPIESRLHTLQVTAPGEAEGPAEVS